MYDLIIIGSGPAGLSAAVYGIRAGLNILVLEKNPMSGGQITNSEEVDNYLGLPEIDGFELGMRFRAHADKLGAPFLEAEVLWVEDKGDMKLVRTKKEVFEAKTVILATGARYAHLEVPGEEALTGRGVSYCATCDGAFYQDKTVAIVGGGDVALGDAILLAKICRKVYLIHRRDKFRATAILQEELRNFSNIEIFFQCEVKIIKGEETVCGVQIENVQTHVQKELEVQGVFIAIGIEPETSLLSEIVACDEKGYILAGEDCRTDRSGILVAGDVRKKPLRQVVSAVTDGANAAMSAAKYCTKK